MKHASAALMIAATLLAACSDGDHSYTIEEVREDRTPEIPRGAGRTDLQRLGLNRMRNTNPHGGNPHGGDPHAGMNMGGKAPSGAPKFAWDLPEGWKELPLKQFRDANFTLERDSSVECFLTIMPGGGGGLVGNVNRWRGQMKLQPMPAAEIGKLPKVKMAGGDATFVELKGTFVGRGGTPKADYGFLATYLEIPTLALTLKMTGPAHLVAAEKSNFLRVAALLRRNAAHGSPHGAPKGDTPTPGAGSDGIAAGMASGASGFTWTSPQGWTKGRDRSMRVVTLHPGGDKSSQCYVAMMGGDGGGLDMNVNRWLEQVGSATKPPAEIAKLPKIDMLGAKGVLVEGYGNFKGMGAEDKQGAGLLGVVCLLDGRAVFVKFIGSADVVKKEKDAFLAFAKSLKMGH